MHKSILRKTCVDELKRVNEELNNQMIESKAYENGGLLLTGAL